MIPTEFYFCGRQVFLERGASYNEDADIVRMFIHFIQDHPASARMVLDPEWAVRWKATYHGVPVSPRPGSVE